jgi:hypothetical protein
VVEGGETVSKLKGTAWKEVWDFDYLSTSDEEDNEDSSDNGSVSSESVTDSDAEESDDEKKKEKEEKVEKEEKKEEKEEIPEDLNNHHHPRKRVKKMIDKFETDVVINLIKKDEALLIRDKAARLLKIQYRNHI